MGGASWRPYAHQTPPRHPSKCSSTGLRCWASDGLVGPVTELAVGRAVVPTLASALVSAGRAWGLPRHGRRRSDETRSSFSILAHPGDVRTSVRELAPCHFHGAYSRDAYSHS